MIKSKNLQKIVRAKQCWSVFLLSLVIAACGNSRRPGLSDKELFAKRKVETLQETEEQEPDFSDMEDKVVPAGIKYRESRAVDPAHPPVVLDIANRNLNIRKFNLSDYYAKVRYVKIKHPLPVKEGNFLFDAKYQISYENGMSSGSGLNSQFSFYNDSIVAGDVFFGYHSYDNDGKFLHTVKTYDFQKVYDVSKNTISYDRDDYMKALARDANNRSNNRFRVNDETMASYVYNRTDTSSTDFLFTFGLKGDTLCRFRNYNPMYDPNKKRSPISWRPPARMYYFEGILTVNQAMNDTVYRMTAPNRLVPVYVINYGPYKLDIDLADDFSNKYFPDKWKETDKFVLFTYNKDRDFPNNRTNGIVKFFYAYYDKQSRQFYHFCDETTIPEQQFLIENQVPDTLPFMLSSVNIMEKHLWVCYSKKRLEEIIENKEFASLPSEQQNKLKTMQNELDDSEVLIMILE